MTNGMGNTDLHELPKISIVTISFNQARFLERAIHSVLTQDYPYVEYIVVDPGSTDGSRDIIECYRDQIDKIILEPDSGPADGLNKGFESATGEILGYLNSDDAYLPRALTKVAASFQRHTDTEVISAHGYIVDEDGRIQQRFYSYRFTPWRFVHGGAVVMQQSTFVRRHAFNATNGFNPSNPIWWDAELLLDLARLGMRMRVINDFWSVFTIHPHSISGQRDIDSQRARKVASDRKLTHERLYRSVTGHDMNRWTPLFILTARVHKWLRHPMRFAWRVIEKSTLPIRARAIRSRTIRL